MTENASSTPTPDQLAAFLDLWRETCALADLNEVPQVRIHSCMPSAGIFYADENGSTFLDANPALIAETPPAVQRYVLAHEIGHLKLDHLFRSRTEMAAAPVTSRANMVVFMAALLGYTGGIGMWVAAALVAALTVAIVAIAFARAGSRRRELAADQYATRLLGPLDDDAAAWITAEWGGPKRTDPWSTHPAWPQRIAAMRAAPQ